MLTNLKPIVYQAYANEHMYLETNHHVNCKLMLNLRNFEFIQVRRSKGKLHIGEGSGKKHQT